MDDIFSVIFSFLDVQTLCSCSQVCKKFHRITINSIFWNNLLKRDFNCQLSGGLNVYKKYFGFRCIKNTLKLEESVSKLETLKQIFKQKNEIIIPEQISCLKQLRVLTFTHSSIFDVPPSLQELEHLECLDLSNNEIRTIEIWRSRSLKSLNISKNKFSKLPELPVSLKNFYAQDNKLSEVPTHLPNIEIISMSRNCVKNLPDLFFCQTTLQRIYLDCNQLAILPAHIKYLRNLKILHLEHNSILEIPREIMDLKKLVEFHCPAKEISAEVEKYLHDDNWKLIMIEKT